VSTNLTPEERFWPRVNKTDTCWLWTGNINHHGYVERANRDGRAYLPRPEWETMVADYYS
jgi:hypothetical protein